jgi:hypothetical protein
MFLTAALAAGPVAGWDLDAGEVLAADECGLACPPPEHAARPTHNDAHIDSAARRAVRPR